MLLSFIASIIVLGIALMIVAKLPLGIEIDSAGTAFAGGAVIGFFNALGGLVPQFLSGFLGLVSLGLIPLLTATLVFGLAAALVDGFRLRGGLASALVGAIALSIVNGVLRALLGVVGIL